MSDTSEKKGIGWLGAFGLPLVLLIGIMQGIAHLQNATSGGGERADSARAALASIPARQEGRSPREPLDDSMTTIGGGSMTIVVPKSSVPAPPKVAKKSGDEVGAWVACQQFVENRLRAPGTAKFPWGYSRYTKHLNGGRYRVAAYVDAENAFGALLRTHFVCEAEHLNADEWRLVSLDFSE